VGKSTLLNAALEMPLAIVSPAPQTTRDAILGIVRHAGAEIALLDTPGLHRARTELGRRMNRTARDAAQGADVVVFVTDVPTDKEGGEKREGDAPRELAPHPGDLALLADIGAGAPTLLVVNKVDRLKDKRALLALIERYMKVRSFEAIVPISARRADGVARVLDEVARLCPEGPARYEEDALTDRPTRFFAAEYVREQILLATKEEVPHASAVVIDEFVEPAGAGATRIAATIHVERAGQKKILVGAAGEMLKRIGTRARARIEELYGRKVHLELWVRVTPAWRGEPRQLDELGYGARGSEGGEGEGA
jgi:GTP-binding protein Era